MKSLEYFQEKYGIDKGLIKFNQAKTRASTLEKFIKKYGEEEGKIQWNLYKSGITQYGKKGTLEYYTNRYGKEKGELKYFEKNKKLSIGANTLKFNGYSEEEILRIKKNHRRKKQN